MLSDRDKILIDNLRAYLKIYQKIVMWSMLSAVVFLLFTLNHEGNVAVGFLYSDLRRDIVWAVAFVLFLFLGAFGRSTLNRALYIITHLKKSSAVAQEALLYPSLALESNGLLRVGSVLIAPIIVVVAIVIELLHERSLPSPVDSHPGWFEIGLVILMLLSPYFLILERIGMPLGSRPVTSSPSMDNKTAK